APARMGNRADETSWPAGYPLLSTGHAFAEHFVVCSETRQSSTGTMAPRTKLPQALFCPARADVGGFELGQRIELRACVGHRSRHGRVEQADDDFARFGGFHDSDQSRETTHALMPPTPIESLPTTARGSFTGRLNTSSWPSR